MNAWQTIIESVILRIGWTLVHSLWQAIAVAGLLAMSLRLMRNASASRRYVVCCIALAATVVSAGVTFALLGAPPVAAVRVDVVPPVFVGADQAVRPVTLPALMLKRDAVASDRENILRCVVIVWLVGVVIMTIRQIGGWACLVSMRRGRTLAEFEPVMERLRRRLNIRRAVRLIETVRLDVPAVMGVVRPVIFISLGVLNDLTPQQVEAILAHELAHIRRHDYLVNLLQAAVESLMFYHPAVWWISGSIRAEREHCCDDVARSICGDGAVYAAALATLESRRDRAIGSALAPSSSGGDLLGRVRRILNLPPAPQRLSVRSLAVAVLALGCLALPLLVHAQQQQKPEPPTTKPSVPSDQNKQSIDAVTPAAAAQPRPKAFELTGVQRAFPGSDVGSQKIDGYGVVTITADKLQPGAERIAAVHGPITNPVQLGEFLSRATTGPAAAQPAARFDFVNVAVSQTGLLHDGKSLDLATLRKVLEAMPAAQRHKTVLAVAAASPQVTVERYFSAIAELDPLVKEFQLAYLSQTGIAPTTAPAASQPTTRSANRSGEEYFMDGYVRRADAYGLPAGGITLRQAIGAAGGLEEDDAMIYVVRKDERGKYGSVATGKWSQLSATQAADTPLRANDLVRIYSLKSGQLWDYSAKAPLASVPLPPLCDLFEMQGARQEANLNKWLADKIGEQAQFLSNPGQAIDFTALKVRVTQIVKNDPTMQGYLSRRAELRAKKNHLFHHMGDESRIIHNTDGEIVSVNEEMQKYLLGLLKQQVAGIKQ